MSDDKTDYEFQQFNAGDMLKKNTIVQLFRCIDDACKKQETLSENSYETSFTKRVDLIESLLWKYTPKNLREIIIKLHDELENKIDKLDKTELSEKNKQLNKQNKSYEYYIEIFKILTVVLTNSPISVEFVEMEIKGDFKDLIKNIRQLEPVKLLEEID